MISKPNALRLFFYLVALAGALYYPISQIVAFECPDTPPKSYLFRLQAYDPYDPMRGRYIRLRLLPNSLEARQRKNATGRRRIRRMYAELGRDSKGFAIVTRLVEKKEQIGAGKDFTEVIFQGNRGTWDQKKRRIGAPYRDHFSFPFKRFYLNETIAPEADALIQNLTRGKHPRAVLKVKIYKDGKFAVEELLLDGKPISELARANLAKSKKAAGTVKK